jgi:hypothetical protein
MTNAAPPVPRHFTAQPPVHARPEWAIRRQWQRLLDAWKAWQQARADWRIDHWYSSQRNAHERFLANAHDHFELERLERAWERNPEWWR